MTNKHGDRVERREIRTTTRLAGYLPEWPEVAQVCRVDRTVVRAGRITTEHAYLATSLTPEEADPTVLLRLNRSHWAIENSYHWVLDAVFGEDREKARRGRTALALRLLRGAALTILRVHGFRAIAPTRRRLAARPREALALVGVATGLEK